MAETRIFLAPANPATRSFAAQLERQGIEIAGYVDNLKVGSDIYNEPSQLPDHAEIYVLSGAVQSQICNGFVARGFLHESIFYQPTQEEISIERWPQFKPSKTLRFNQGIKLLKLKVALGLKSIMRTFGLVNRTLYYSESFIDTNTLLAYRYHRTQSKNAYLSLCDAQQTLVELNKDNHFTTSVVLTWWYWLRAKVLVIDHEYTSERFSTFRQSASVLQLWHGIPYKSLTGNQHYPIPPDHTFSSSSTWFNNLVFPKIFKAKQYKTLGYPRCDALIQAAEERDWINAEPQSELRVIEAKTGPIIVYAPTYRDNDDQDYPIDLDVVEGFCRSVQKSFILKFHPFISRMFADAMGLQDTDNIQPIPGYPHIYLYPSAKNIYPWLAEAQVLISDYSSITIDFWVTGKPIIYYWYDQAAYLQNRGASLMQDSDFIAGDVVNNLQELVSLLQTSASNVTRTKAPKLLLKFGIEQTLSAPRVFDYVRQLHAEEQS